jgi:hypothetical protein
MATEVSTCIGLESISFARSMAVPEREATDHLAEDVLPWCYLSV